MQVYVAIDGDNIGQLVGRLSLAEDIAGLRRVSSAIASGNEAWAKWAQEHGGEVISDGGDEGRFLVESEFLGELETLRERYRKTTGHSCSVGIGLKISEADKALLIAKLRGKDRKIFWEPSMGKELDDAQHDASDEAKKISEHYLKKGIDEPGLRKADDGGKQLEAVGTQGNNELVGNDPGARKISGQEHLAARFARAAGTPHSPGAGGGDEEAPTDQEQVSATKEAPESGTEQEQVKQKIAEILTKVKEQAPMLEKMRQQAPDLYEAVKGAVEAMLLMARETLPDEEAGDVSKSEFGEDDLSKACKCDAYKFPHREAGGKCKATKMKKDAKREADPTEPVPSGEELDKAAFQTKLNMKYPTGTTKQGAAPGNGNRETGKVKVKPNEYNGGEKPKTGETKWRSVRAGVVMAPDGTPTSSLNPSGK